MAWIQPLEMKTWILSVFAGSSDIFLAFALFVIFGMSAYFRMNGIAMFFMLAIFLVMFNEFISDYMLLIVGIVGGLLVGFWASKIWKN